MLFREWFHVEFLCALSRHLKSRNPPEKAVLVLDNAACHHNELQLKKGNINADFFLPPCATSLIQPMDQAVWSF